MKTTTALKPFEESGGLPVLTLDEERELSGKIQKGDVKALKKMVLRNLRFVYKIVNRYKGQGVDFEDLVSVGRLALIKAASKYVSNRGAKFSTYAAHWIKSQVIQYLIRYRGVVSVPPYVPMVRKQYKRYLEKCEKDGIEGSEKGFALQEHRDVNVVKWIVGNSYQKFVSTDELANVGILIKQEQDDMEVGGFLQEGELTEIVRHCDFLTSFEKVVLVYRYGLNGNPPMLLDDIAAFLGRTGERIRQTEVEALDKLKWRLRQNDELC